MEFSMPELIRKKRDGWSLSEDEMQYFIQSAFNGEAHDSQIGAMLMAMYKSDLTDEETYFLVSSMVKSGISLNWPGTTVDKHSTGGVGDKVSIVLVPALAALGLTVPMVSGRGLGWTGGTLDKLESIPGFRVELIREDMEKCLQQCSCFIAATTNDLCPADKVLYKIRDITSTVDNINLITGSILSKKIAAGIKNLVLDIKVGAAAFMKNIKDAEELANKMISTSKMFNMKTRVLLTAMDNPIGLTIGNSVEIEECIDTLLGKGPTDLLELVTNLGGELMQMSDKADSAEEGRKKLEEVINNGEALKCFLKMLRAQKVSQENVNKLGKGDYSPFPKSKLKTEIKSEVKGFIESIQGLCLGKATWALGAGRTKPEDSIDHTVGIRINKAIGDHVDIGETMLTVYHNKPLTKQLENELYTSVRVTDKIIIPSKIIIKTIRDD